MSFNVNCLLINNLDLYKKKVNFNITDGLRTTFPITFKLLGEALSKQLIKDFITNHKCINYQFWRMPEELLGYVIEIF